MRFLILTNAGNVNGPRTMPNESTTTGPSDEARARFGGPHPLAQSAHVRSSAHKMSVVDGPFPETKQ